MKGLVVRLSLILHGKNKEKRKKREEVVDKILKVV